MSRYACTRSLSLSSSLSLKRSSDTLSLSLSISLTHIFSSFSSSFFLFLLLLRLLQKKGDVKLDNLFFAENDEIVAVDWGLCGWSHPLSDVAYFFGRSFEPDDIKLWKDELLELYHTSLLSFKPELKNAFSLETCHKDLSFYAIGTFLTFVGALKAQAENVDKKTGMFSENKESMTEADQIKSQWWDDSARRWAGFAEIVDVAGALEERCSKDPSYPLIPCCCLWTTPAPLKKKK
jgi:hypothetical protein